MREHGTAANQVLWRGQVPLMGDANFTDHSIVAMDRWLAAVERDKRRVPLARKIIQDKPADLTERCTNGAGTDGPPGVRRDRAELLERADRGRHGPGGRHDEVRPQAAAARGLRARHVHRRPVGPLRARTSRTACATTASRAWTARRRCRGSPTRTARAASRSATLTRPPPSAASRAGPESARAASAGSSSASRAAPGAPDAGGGHRDTALVALVREARARHREGGVLVEGQGRAGGHHRAQPREPAGPARCLRAQAARRRTRAAAPLGRGCFVRAAAAPA